MEEKRNVTICFSSDEMYIYKYFKSKGKASTEMKRILKDYVENNQVRNDSSEVVDERVAKILSAILGSGGIQNINIPSTPNEIILPTNNNSSQENNLSSKESEMFKDESPEDSFDLPPDDILGAFQVT